MVDKLIISFFPFDKTVGNRTTVVIKPTTESIGILVPVNANFYKLIHLKERHGRGWKNKIKEKLKEETAEGR